VRPVNGRVSVILLADWVRFPALVVAVAAFAAHLGHVAAHRTGVGPHERLWEFAHAVAALAMFQMLLFPGRWSPVIATTEISVFVGMAAFAAMTVAARWLDDGTFGWLGLAAALHLAAMTYMVPDGHERWPPVGYVFGVAISVEALLWLLLPVVSSPLPDASRGRQLMARALAFAPAISPVRLLSAGLCVVMAGMLFDMSLAGTVGQMPSMHMQ
jgi:hypothetical protein